MRQKALVTSYITSILNSEMEDCLEILHTSEEFLSTYKKDRQEEVTDSLRKIKEGLYLNIMALWILFLKERIPAVSRDG